MPHPMLLLRMGTEGGSIEVYCDRDDLALGARYRAVIADQTFTFLNDEEGGKESRRDPG